MIFGSIVQRQYAEYEPLILNFINQVKGLDVKGMPEPHIPAIGNSYENCRYKIAFCGMETNGWGSLKSFIDNGAYKTIDDTNDRINDLEFLNWKKNDHATFWAFVLKFLACFYNISYNELCEGKHPEVLRSFIWANTNAIERYEVSAKEDGANQEIWKQVKEASLPFDNLNHIINVANPNVVFILYSNAQEEFFLTLDKGYLGLNFSNRQTYLKQQNSILNYRYYFRRDSNTHIFCLPHPRWMGQYSGKSIDEYVISVVNDLQIYNVWNLMPKDLIGHWFEPIKPVDKSSMEYKCKFIASLAKFLIDNNSVMSGQELQNLLNRNNIKTNWGGEYSSKGGRGIHKLITRVWNYYYSNLDFQTAYNIARAFVKQNGEYAYE